MQNRFRSFVLGAAGVIALLSLAWGAIAQQTAPRNPAPTARAQPQAQPQAQAAPRPPVSFLALEQLQGAGVRTCLPLMNELLRATVDVEHAGVANWNRDNPDQRAVSSINITAYPNDIAPRAISFVSAAPTRSGYCDGEKIRVQPSRLSCDAIAANLARQNAPQPAVMSDVRTYPPSSQGSRLILLPAAAGGCVVIDAGTFYGR